MKAETGSPGASASKRNTRIVIPKKIGIAMRTRRTMYVLNVHSAPD